MNDILGMSIILDTRYKPNVFEFPMHADLRLQITEEMKKNRGITVKGKRIANLFNFLYDKCDEEPHFT